ncbi:hypothetical protein NMY22_g20166 [Coprinellus aureogranulatus]|nr:hypothetical protein NMY22_g20166 [Coprinellus aureogranulatus]
MLSILTSLLIAPFFVNRVAAHGAVTGYRINGEVYPGYDAYAPPEGQSTIARPFLGIDPLFDVLNETIGCNSDRNPIGKEGKQLTATIRAGDTITAIYGLWIHPFGPATVYLARCPGRCSEVNSKELEWFKIDHAVSGCGSVEMAGGSLVRDGEAGKGICDFSDTALTSCFESRGRFHVLGCPTESREAICCVRGRWGLVGADIAAFRFCMIDVVGVMCAGEGRRWVGDSGVGLGIRGEHVLAFPIANTGSPSP